MVRAMLIRGSAGAAGNFLAPILQLSTNAFRAVVEIDVIGSYNTVKATIPYLLGSAKKNPGSSRLGLIFHSMCKSMLTRGLEGGRIIFISSTTGYTGTQLVTHGAAAKFAVDTLSAQVAIELGPRGITSNVIAPGPISGTEGSRRLIETGKTWGRSRKIPLGRLGSLKDMGDAVVYLFSDAGSFVNGAILVGKLRTLDLEQSLLDNANLNCPKLTEEHGELGVDKLEEASNTLIPCCRMSRSRPRWQKPSCNECRGVHKSS